MTGAYSPTDTLFLNATVIDGLGGPRYVASVLISEQRRPLEDGEIAGDSSSGAPASQFRIVSISPRIAQEEVNDLRSVGGRVIDCEDGKWALCPGFIDMHAHSDLSLLHTPDHEAKISQGVTCEVIGQDGIGYAPVDKSCLPDIRRQIAGWNGNPQDEGFFSWTTTRSYLDTLDARKIATNAAYLVPQGNLRLLTIGYENRPATAEEMKRMEAILAQALEEGAVGMSSGLTYVPGMFASTSELAILLGVVASYGGYYSPHTRSYGKGAMEAYAEMISLARETGVRLHLTHCTLNFAENCGRAEELLAMIDEALREGVEVTLDTYPYLPGSTTLAAILPSWAASGGVDATLARLRDPTTIKRVQHELEEVGSDGHHGCVVDWDQIEISGTVDATLVDRYVGRTLKVLGNELGRAPFDMFVEVLLADSLGPTILHHVGHESNVRAIMRHPRHTGGSDGILVSTRPHPRAWGTFPRYLGHYARDLPGLTDGAEVVFAGGLEECVHHLTARAANVLRLSDRGRIKVGYRADLVVFDPTTVCERATFEQPKQPAAGIRFVMVNGQLALDETRMTGTRAGRTIRLRRAGEADASDSSAEQRARRANWVVS